ncbi:MULTISPECIES: type II toxin-antitoxin system VapC family toxin [unclassified Meiothermus]|uniref:type II toxin-antitoxin system VapC family toxin n=1 Tax=unclassified Meiothermus TaxID=370471 RepID=UPI000D7C3DB7|nr:MULTISPECIES: type II toxin-antitoxin system VapC family toxin [unclassified Meiothermus]PZA06038.1 PIN domain nuclease [Meiothermus sp. Pnk-1]RYM36166.1 PIN domain-containing protein [Meiothermus sp. PNK-Is4]
MISLDTNVIFSALNPADLHHTRARRLLREHGAAEVLVLSPVVYAELMASSDAAGIRLFLQKAQITTLWEMPQAVWEAAGRAFGQYARLRRGGVLPRRILADFLIAAHAEHHGLEVMSFDDAIYAEVFPELRLIG